MRLAGLASMAQANAWLAGFMARFNRRFAVAPGDPIDAHLPYSGSATDLKNILCMQTTKTLSKNLTCQYQGKLIQLTPSGSGLALRQAKVTLHAHFDGTLEVYWQGRAYAYTLCEKPPRQAPETDSKTLNARVDEALAKRAPSCNKRPKPPSNHPWRHSPIGQPAAGRQAVTI